MASREKKLSTGKKQASASPVPPKEAVASVESPSKPKTESSQAEDGIPKLVAVKPITPKAAGAKAEAAKRTVLAKKITKTVGKKAMGKTLSLNLKAKAKRAPKIKQQLVKALLNNAKTKLENKSLLKNGVKPKKPRGKVQTAAKSDDTPPVLEPMLPLVQTAVRKIIKKRVKKVPVPNENAKKVKKEMNLASIDDTINSILSQIMAEEEEKLVKKPVKPKKSKPETLSAEVSETIEDVMNDLSHLIKSEEVKPESEVVDLTKTEPLKPKKASAKKTKADTAKKKIVKKETIERSLAKNITLDASAKHLIDMLDLSVCKTKQLSTPICSRRHSIERFSVDAVEKSDSSTAASTLGNLSKTITPRSKRVCKARQSVDTRMSLKRYSPYSTRSDSPAQILRNGKHRKLKDNSLLEGLDTIIKRRKRLCSDFSGSEKSVSKLSGYESDSSFSDKASCYGVDITDQKDGPVKAESLVKKELETINQIPQGNKSASKLTDIKRSLSTDTAPNGVLEVTKSEQKNFMDSNSNLCNDIKPNVQTDHFNTINNEFPMVVNPSAKVPEKSIILDIMKQTFNDISQEDHERRTTRASSKKSNKAEEEKQKPISTNKFYGSTDQPESNLENKAVSQETKEETKVPTETTPEKEESSISSDEPPKLDPENKTEISDSADPPESNVETNISSLEVETDVNMADAKASQTNALEETPENLAIKENILQALGLQSLKAAEEAKLKGKVTKNDYTGTLKTVIKLNRCEKKKGRTTMKMALQKNKKAVNKEGDIEGNKADDDLALKNIKEATTSSWRAHTVHSSDTAGALRKSHYSNRSNLDGSSEHTSDGDTAAAEGDDAGKVLVIPEKASSFSIHPGRLCKDECSYCFGKFGLFDTPCHIAQMKSVERQNKILATEKHLTRDSCLCDACYRHVDRKSNTPSYLNKGSKRNNLVAPGPRQNHCHVLGCGSVATNILRRKWLIKMRKSVCQVINIDLDNPGLHSIPICDEHYSALEHLMICAMCKRRLARNHIHYLGPEVNDLNRALNAEGIPVKLLDKPVVCKICRYFASLILKPVEERQENATVFFVEYKKRLLHFHDIEVMDDAATEEPIPIPIKEKVEKEPIKKRKRLNKSNGGPPVLEPQIDLDKNDPHRMTTSDSNSTGKSRSESPSDYMVDYHTLIPNIAMDCSNETEPIKQAKGMKKTSRPESIIKEAVEISKTLNKFKNNCDSLGLSKNSAIAVQRLGSNPCISVRQLFPGEEELGLQGHIEFGNVKEKTPEGWEKCISTIQYDTDTKLLWQELQKPYGNQSSFLRHLILLEKYFRSGDLILSSNASHHSINYSESVQNRLHAYDNIPTHAYNSVSQNVKKSTSGIITTKDSLASVSIVNATSIHNAANIPKNTPLTISQITNISPASTVTKAKNPGVPPGLISLQSGNSRSTTTTLVKVPQSQKIKIPITKNWRPNLIPIDPNKKSDKKPGYVKVISGGKPYHITVDDYNRMCAIKKSYDLKQKRLLEAQSSNSTPVSISQGTSLLKSIIPRKGLTISKTSTITSPKSDSTLDGIEAENSLEKLDRTVENLESKLTGSSTIINLPKIPKSLTVIPQTVTHKPVRTSSPSLMITPKPKPSTSRS